MRYLLIFTYPKLKWFRLKSTFRQQAIIVFLLFWQVDIPGGSAHRDTMLVKYFCYHFFHFRVIWIEIEYVADNIGQALIRESL